MGSIKIEVKVALSLDDLRLASIDLQNKQSQKKKKKVEFIAYVNETNHGCDYTIACGKTLWELEAKTKEEALLELKRKITPPLEDDEGIYELEDVVLYQVSDEISVPIETWYSERVEEERNRMAIKKLEEEHMEYKRLKEKYG